MSERTRAGRRRSGAAGACGKASPIRWTAHRRAAFLDMLSASCNVRAAAQAAGVTTDIVYARRRRDESFADEWQVALLRGYQLLETLLVGQALAGGGPVLTGGDPERPPIDVEMAMRLLTVHRQRAERGQPASFGRRPQIATRDETNAAILARLKKIEKARRRPARSRATDRDGGRS